jgi:glycosyltransferase involved in cell wall biosynthesis
MRIAYLCTDLGVPVCGNKGASIHVRELSRALQALGHEVAIVCARLGGSPPAGFDVPLLEFPLEEPGTTFDELLRSDPSAGPVVARMVRGAVYASSLPARVLPSLRGFDPDVVYERYALNGSAGLAIAEALEVAHVVEVNAPLADEEEAHRGLAFAETARTLERAIVRRAGRVVAVSEELKRWLAGLGVADAKITVIPNAVDPARFDVPRQVRRAARRRLQANGTPVVAFVGTLKPWHDPLILVRALGLLRERGVAPRLLVVGDGPGRAGVEELATDEGLSSQLTFTGPVSHDEVPAYLAAADVAVATYHPETGGYFSPLKLFEYLASGLPVVAAEVGEIPHCIRPGETGLLYPPGDAEALADALATLIADRDGAAALGRNGREHARRHHTWESNAKAVANVAAELLEEAA